MFIRPLNFQQKWEVNGSWTGYYNSMSYCLQNRVFRVHGKNWHLNCMSDSKPFMMLSFWIKTHYYGVSWIWHSQNSAHHYTKKFGCFVHLISFYLFYDCGQDLRRLSCQEPSKPTLVPSHNLHAVCRSSWELRYRDLFFMLLLVCLKLLEANANSVFIFHDMLISPDSFTRSCLQHPNSLSLFSVAPLFSRPFS